MRKIISTYSPNSKFWRITAIVCTISALLFFSGCSSPSGDGSSYESYIGGIVTQSDVDLTVLTIAEGSPSSTVVTDPPFAYHVTDYTLWVTENYSSVTFNAAARGATSTISATTFENDGVTDIGASETTLTSGVDGAIALSLDGTPGDEANELANIIKVTVTEGTDEKVYRFKVRPRYTSTNYTFDGEIDTLLQYLTTSWKSITEAYTVVGVITSKDIYSSKGGDKSFIVQDAYLGLMIGSDETLGFPLGAKVRVTINNVDGCEYYDQPLVQGYETIELISLNNTIAYRTGTTGNDFMDAASEDNSGMSYATSGWCSLVYKYTVDTDDGVLVEPDRYSSGQFDLVHLHNHFVYGDQGHAYSINRGMEAYVQPGDKGDYFGPVISSYGYSIHLALPTQVRVFE